MSNQKIIVWLLKVFLIWRLILVLAAFLGQQFLSQNLDFVAGRKIEWFNGQPFTWQENPLLSAWANFDGVHYLKIATEGYHTTHYAFFPLYPLLIKYLNVFFRQPLLSGLIISHLAFLGALLFLFKISYEFFGEKIAKKTTLSLLIFPTSFFFVCVYNESLFLFLVLASFYASLKKRWWLAGILAAFAGSTRLVGFFLLPSLFIEYYSQKETKNNSFPWGLFLAPLGLIFYMLFLQKTVHDPLYFFHVQPSFGAERSGQRIILPYQVVWRYLRIFWTVPFRTYSCRIACLEFFSTLVAATLLVWAWLKKKIRQSYLVFSFLTLVVPTLTGTLSSMPRYVLVCFPIFMVFGTIKNKFIQGVLAVVSFSLLLLLTALFTSGHWVA